MFSEPFNENASTDIWSLDKSPVNVEQLALMLMNYPDEASADILYNGFKYGFLINYTGPRTTVECNNLKSIY